MAAKSREKVDMRRLMREQRKNVKSKEKIDSPLAKYSSTGQLYCVLCNAPVKSELLWDAHVQGKKHREMLMEIKNKKQNSNVNAVSKTSQMQLVSKNKSPKFQRPADPLESKRKQVQVVDEIPQKKPKVNQVETSSNLPADFFDNSSSKRLVDTADSEKEGGKTQPSKSGASLQGLPEDFFDKGSVKQAKETSETMLQDNRNSSQSEAGDSLPEGFFDDPKLDAKARKVEYKDPAEEEWERFQKAMQMENQVSEAIVDVDDEESRIDRQLTELSEQRLYFLRADSLRDKRTVIKDELQKNLSERRKAVDEKSDSDSEDFEEFLDWRAKKAL